MEPGNHKSLISHSTSAHNFTATYTRSVDASREVEEGEKSDGSSDDDFAKEKQEVGHLVQNGHSNLGKNAFTHTQKHFMFTMFLKMRPKACFADLQKLLPWEAVKM